MVQLNYYVDDVWTCSERVECIGQMIETTRKLERQHPRAIVSVVGDSTLATIPTCYEPEHWSHGQDPGDVFE